MSGETKAPNEVKPSFTLEFIGLQVLIIVLTFLLTTAGTLFVNGRKSKNYIDVTTSVSQNLADINPTTSLSLNADPSAIYPSPPSVSTTPAFQVFLNSGNNKSRAIRYLGRYDILIKNASSSAIDDFQLVVSIPLGITFVQQPVFVTEPSGIAQTISTLLPAQDGSGVKPLIYKIGLLNPGGAIRISAFGYNSIESYGYANVPLKVAVNKKEWFQRDIAASPSERTYQQDNNNQDNPFSKNISDWAPTDYIYIAIFASVMLYLINNISSHIRSLFMLWKKIKAKKLGRITQD